MLLTACGGVLDPTSALPGPLSADAQGREAASPATSAPPSPTPSVTPSPAEPAPDPGFATLTADLTAMAAQSGRHVGIALVETGGPVPQRWSLGGGDSFTAASTYKLPLLMWEAQGVATGRLHDGDLVCYEDDDREDGWYTDYTDGACYTRLDLSTRIGQHSDNTAAHMLVRDMGGPDVLNAFARGAGATASAFWYPNTTTPLDLAAIWSAESAGSLGGPAALRWLTPLLSHNETTGILAGLPATASALSKWGWIDDTENDAALVLSAPAGPYVLVIMSSGDGSDQGWDLLTAMSARVWQYESAHAP
jgi:beta-lactamase class A